MTIIYHDNYKVFDLKKLNSSIEFKSNNLSIAGFICEFCIQNPEELVVWCHISLKEQLNILEIEKLFHHKKMLLSYSPQGNFFDSKIGYVEESPFIKVNKEDAYPTWQMSSVVGVVHASLLNELKDNIKLDTHFDYYLSGVAKLCMPLGLLCYSEPKLLKNVEPIANPKADMYTLFRFVKQHYKTRWVFLLWLNLVIYERKFLVLPVLFSLFYQHRNNRNINLDGIAVKSSKKIIDKGTIDVMIPTIGRKKYLYDVLCDLRNQTHLPKNVIIIEQNPQENSASELAYLTAEKWPFNIKHTFTHQAGVCNARNLALDQLESEWVFLADDDIRIANNFIEKYFENMKYSGNNAFTMRCYQKGDKSDFSSIKQWPTFGSGCSIVFAETIKDCKFRMGYEFGFGEDADFGMQLRNKGVDVLYLPEPEILHLKAPMGGFRTKPFLAWQNDPVQPKPSPTVMLYHVLHSTKEQLLGYKTILLIKYYQHQKIKNPIQYYRTFQKQWKQSMYWANNLNKSETL